MIEEIKPKNLRVVLQLAKIIANHNHYRVNAHMVVLNQSYCLCSYHFRIRLLVKEEIQKCWKRR